MHTALAWNSSLTVMYYTSKTAAWFDVRLHSFSTTVWLMHQNLCSWLVSHQWWCMLWHLRKKILSSSSCTVTLFFKVYFSVACLLAVLAAGFDKMPTCPALNWQYGSHGSCVFSSQVAAVQSFFGGGVSEAQEWHWDGFSSFGLEGGGGHAMKISVAQ